MFETGHRERVRKAGERAILVGAAFPGDPDSAEEPLAELSGLARTAGAVAVARLVQKRDRPDASTFYGRGKAAEVAALAAELSADLVITDEDLSPAQLRNLERIVGTRVVDRTELILDIFALHARSHEARLQVELAQAEYLLPRLRRMWTHLSREGGTGQSSGVGTRGPGEKQLEIDRRLLRNRVAELRRELEAIGRRRKRMAEAREEYFKVSLVGYTNGGKSTLLRRLTGAEALVEDQLFSTLDTQTRAWALPGGKRVFLSDTVGFLRDLPHHLVASFHATLEEVRSADLLLHVADASHPDVRMQIEAVEGVLEELGADRTPRILVLNKSDLVRDPVLLHASGGARRPVCAISALYGGPGTDELGEEVERIIAERQSEVDCRLPAGAGRLLAFLAERGTVLERRYADGQIRLRVRLGPADRARARRMAAEAGAVISGGDGGSSPE
ncbi:MAG: GTPase HflX [Planctomycetota bacterium]